MKVTDLAYLAGLFDGEGTISCSITETKKGNKALHKQLSIFNTNFTLITWIISRFGGTIHSRKRNKVWKEEHQVKWSAEDGYWLLRAVLPYLVIKREQAELYLALHETKTTKVTTEIQEQRELLVARVRELNKRGTNKETNLA